MPAATASADDILVRVENLSVTLSTGVRAVDGIDFTIRGGECVALVGESGCGKTLTALSLLRSLPPGVEGIECGRMEFDGRRLDKMSAAELRRMRGREIGMVFQDPTTSFNPLFTVGGQIVETIRVHLPVSKTEAESRALESLREAGLPDAGRVFGAYPHQLSGGQRQRAFIAMALATGPRLLIADEPTTALDVTVQRQILDLLARLAAGKNLALLLITHNLSVVARLAGRVLIMYAGQIVECADVTGLFTSPAHPYTRALLDCLPRLDSPRAEPPTIPGNVPQPGDWPDGCRFAGRCRFAREKCDTVQELRPLEAAPERLVRCVHAGELWKMNQGAS